MKKMNNTDERIVEKLKELIDENEPDYLKDSPLKVYESLKTMGKQDTVIAGAVLMLIVSGMWNEYLTVKDSESISQEIQKECFFNKKMSDRLATIIVRLYSDLNQSEWEEKRNEGLKQFLKKNHTFNWEGFSVWDAGNGTVDCYYDAEVVLKPVKEMKNNKELQKKLEKNPFVSEDEIYKMFDKALSDHMDMEFKEYCTCDDYYQPVVEDFELEYCVKDWCKKNGFEVVSCEGDGRDSGYEPNHNRGWH